MTLIVDASVVVAALVDIGPVGRWAFDQVDTNDLVAPEQLPAECANALARLERTGTINPTIASESHRDMNHLDITFLPFAPVAERVWNLRFAVTAYDGWYVAIAEKLHAPCATLDLKLLRANGPKCEFITAPSRGD